MSDSHGLAREVTDIKERHQLEYMIHCGDSELDNDAHELKGFYKVAGNCDYDPDYQDEETITINGLAFFITHGHLYNVKANLTTLAYRAEEVHAHVVCFGHTHIAGAEQLDGQLFINPGSIRLPKNRTEKTYAIMEWEGIDKIQIHFYSLNGDVIESLSYQTSL